MQYILNTTAATSSGHLDEERNENIAIEMDVEIESGSATDAIEIDSDDHTVGQSLHGPSSSPVEAVNNSDSAYNLSDAITEQDDDDPEWKQFFLAVDDDPVVSDESDDENHEKDENDSLASQLAFWVNSFDIKANAVSNLDILRPYHPCLNVQKLC